MKTRLLIPLFAASLGLLMAEPPQDNPQPHPPRDGEFRKSRPGEKMRENMSPELRERFDKAREQALKDPKIQELRKSAEESNEAFRNAMRAAMNAADPGLAEAVKAGMGDRMKRHDEEEKNPGFAKLNEADRAKLMAAREKAMNDPAVQAADELRKKAGTPEERRASIEQFHKAMRAAMLKADPSLAPILDEMKPRKPRGENQEPDRKAEEQ